jgi:type I restriction enzyme S subunit
MVMKTEKRVPALRFPMFKNEWKIKKLGEFLEERNEFPQDELPLYSLTIEKGIIPKTERYERSFLVKSKKNAYKLVKKNDFAFNPMNLRFGALARHKENKDVAVSKYYNIFFCKENLDHVFSELYLTSYRLIQFYNKMATGTLEEKKRVHFSEFIKFKIPLPTLPEQQKIASFLTTIDTRIQQLSRKLDLLEQYKKGVMQQIFSQEIRFKPDSRAGSDEGGKDFPEWEERKLGDISTKVMYGMNSAAKSFDGKNKYLRITDIDENSRSFVPNPLTSPEGEILEKYKLKPGDIVFARTGASTGKCYLYTESDGDLYFAGFLIKFSITEAIPYFIFVQTFRNTYSKWVQVMSMRSGQPGINAEEYKSLKLILPSLPEQQKIADFLTAIDAKISLTKDQLDQMQTFKKGLLQQMFV